MAKHQKTKYSFPIRFMSLLFISVLIVSCSDRLSGQATKAPGSIKIGGVFHLTGPAAFWGTGELNAALLAIDDINDQGGIDGANLTMTAEDGQTSYEKTASAFAKLINIDNTKLIIGPTWFGQIASPIADQSKTLIISPSAGTVPQPSPYFFDVWPTESQEVKEMVRYLVKNKIQRVAVLYSQNEWSQSMELHFLNESQSQGMDIVKIFPTKEDENDFRSVIEQLKSLDIQGVYAPFAYYPSQGAFSRQAKELALHVPIFSSSGTDNPELLKSFPEIEGTVYPYPLQSPQESDFAKRYTDRFQIPPSTSSAYAYDSVMILAQALKAGKRSPEEISQYLHGNQTFQGVANTIGFDKDGRLLEKPHGMKIVKDQSFEWLR